MNDGGFLTIHQTRSRATSQSVVGNGRRRKDVVSAGVAGREDRDAHLPEVDTRVELIQALIPIGLEAVNEVLQQEVCQLAGERYSRAGVDCCPAALDLRRNHVDRRGFEFRRCGGYTSRDWPPKAAKRSSRPD